MAEQPADTLPASSFQVANVPAPEEPSADTHDAAGTAGTSPDATGHDGAGHDGAAHDGAMPDGAVHDGMAHEGGDMAVDAGAATPADGTVESTGAHAEGGHGKAGLPQLDTTTFAGQLFWLAITFAFLYLVISRVAAPKIGGVLADRAARIKGDLDEAAAAQRASEAAVANYDKALADARAQATRLSDEVRNKVQAGNATKAAEAERQLSATMQKAEARIAELRTGALARIGMIVRETTSDIVQKLTGDTVPAADLDAAVARVTAKN